MTTGVPIYLVSACASGEEFVAAFRRYSDRGSLFVPIADPLPPGRRGRVALTLADGGVMLDGEVDIISSSKTASVLHGRIGMTIRFLEPDEPTKTLLVELDRARLAVRPTPPTVAPRPADVPAAPRPVPPSPAGRIDPANALAECVSIGDLTALREGAAPLKPGGKFVMPEIPRAGSKVPTVPPKLTLPMEPIPVAAPVPPSKPFRLPTPPPAAVEPPPPDDSDNDVAQIVDAPPRRMPVSATQASAVVPPPTGRAPKPTRPPAPQRMTTLGMTAVTTRTPPLPLPVAPRPPTQDVVPDEPTDVADLRTTAPGVGVPPKHDTPTDAKIDDGAIDAHAPTMPADPTLDAEPEADWTMAPTDDAPTPLVIESSEPPQGPLTGNWTIALTPDGWGEPEKIAASLPAPGPRTAVSGETGPSIAAVAGEKPLDVRRQPEPEIADEGKIQIDPTLMEPLREMPVDPEPLVPPGPPSRPTPAPLPPAPSYPMMVATAPASQPYAAQMQFPQTPPPPRPLDGTGPTSAFREPETRLFDGARMANDRASVHESNRRKKLIIAIVVALVAIGIIVAVLASGGGGDGGKPPATDEVTKVEPPKQPETHVMVPVAPPPADAMVAAEVAPDASTDCAVEIDTVPKDVEIAIDNTTKIGTAPGTVRLPCGTEVKLYLRKPGFAGVIKSITPAADSAPLKVVLLRAQFIVKVSSTPAGATITVAGKPVGITPTTVKLNGFDPVAIQIAKVGYVPQEQKVTPKNTVVHVKLVPKPRSR